MSVQAKLFAIFALSALLGAGCKDSDNTSSPSPVPTTTTPATPAGASEASVTVGVEDAFVSAVAGGGSTFRYSLTMEESAGVGARINFVRLDIFRATGEFEERSEIGAGVIIAGVGDNRLDANASESASVSHFFRATIKKGRMMLLTVGFTDDNGNDLEATFRFTFA